MIPDRLCGYFASYSLESPVITLLPVALRIIRSSVDSGARHLFYELKIIIGPRILLIGFCVYNITRVLFGFLL